MKLNTATENFWKLSFSTLAQQRYANWAEEKFLFSKEKEIKMAKIKYSNREFLETRFFYLREISFSKKERNQ